MSSEAARISNNHGRPRPVMNRSGEVSMAMDPVSTIAAAFRDHGQRLARRAERILGSESEAEDIVQDVMVGILEAPDVLPSIENLVGWLYTTVRRRCIDLIRSDVRRKGREAVAASMDELFIGVDDPAAVMERDEVSDLVADAVSRLSEPQRFVIMQHSFAGRSFRELSVETGEPIGTLLARKKRAIDVIRRSLQEKGIVG